MRDLKFKIFGDDLAGGECQSEAQDALKALHKYQRKIAGLEITRGKKETPKDPPEKETGKKEPAKGKGKKASKLKADDARKAYITVLNQFDKKKELDLAKEVGSRILAKYDTSKLSELDPENFADFIQDCENYTRDDDENEFNQDAEDDVDSMID